MYYNTCDMAILRFYYMLMRCYDIISTVCFAKSYICMFWINWRCSI